MVAFVVVAGVDAFHIDLAVIDLFGQGGAQQGLYLHILDRAALHRKEIVPLIDAAPVDDLMQLLFEDGIQPDAGAAMSVYDIINAQYLVVDQAALAKIEEVYA